MTQATNLGFPRIGAKRELKRALERYWRGDIGADALETTATALRRAHWRLQAEAGLDRIPVGDAALYDHVLDTAVMVGAIPARFGWDGGDVGLDTYFAMARGSAAAPALEMTKWFDSNYHYLVPEFDPAQPFRLADRRLIDQTAEALALGLPARPVLLGPVSFLLLGRRIDAADPLALLDRLLPVYQEILGELAALGVDGVQIDEPCLATDLPPGADAAYRRAYATITHTPHPSLLLTSYFGELGENLALAAALPVQGLHVDLVRAPRQLDDVLAVWPADRSLSLGLVDGRNIWRTDLDAARLLLQRAIGARGGDAGLAVAPSCSLLHVPMDLDAESELDAELREWLAFAVQKLYEVTALARTPVGEPFAPTPGYALGSADAAAARRASRRTHDPAVRERRAGPELLRRDAAFAARRESQRRSLELPLFPTTTIGSFPQTPELRSARADHRAGRLATPAYQDYLREQTADCIRRQEALGLDVLVHGEFERNDMVEYFGEQFTGVAVTRQAWVQSYGSRCVKPPIIYGDLSRPEPMTVDWWRYAQGLTQRPVKGMLTGPITLLQWSFVRDDLPRSDVARQLAFAVRDEVADLEAAGCRIIQVDEPALREGLPLRRADRDSYLVWAVDAFRLATAGAAAATQIHTHMCYCHFGDILPAIASLDADVISIETARSHMALLHDFLAFDYPNEIGPGVFDIHSPRQPSDQEVQGLLKQALTVLPAERIWVNPDCGLKTRRWQEVEPALTSMVAAARELRKAHAKPRHQWRGTPRYRLG